MDVNGYEKDSSIELSKINARGARQHWSVARRGKSLETRAWADGKPPKVTSKALPADAQAREYSKAVRAKLRDGYVFRRDRAGAARGDIVFGAFAATGGGGPLLDLSPDGRQLVTASHSGAPNRVWLDVVDLATGQRRTVFERQSRSQIFLHTAHFDHAGGSLLVALSSETVRVDLATGAVRTLAGDINASGLNSHVVQPRHDQSRRRFVVLDAGAIVRVLDERDQVVLEVKAKHRTTECRSADLSPSGRLLAVYRVSRGILYNHDDARQDTTSEVDVWDLDTGRLRETFKSPKQLSRAGFDPRDELLLATWDHACGPVAYALGSHQERFRVEHPTTDEPDEREPDERLADATDWVWSPDGSLLVLHGRHPFVRDARTRAPVEVELSGHVSSDQSFSADGSLMASYDGGMAVVRAV